MWFGFGRTVPQVKQDRAAVNGVMIHPRKHERGVLHQRFNRAHRDVGQMLVINRVVFRVLKEINQVGNFKGDQCLRVRNRLQARHQIVQVVNVRKDMTPQDQVRRAPLGPEFFCGDGVEEFLARRDRRGEGDVGNVAGGFHAEHVAALLLEFFQKHAGVRGDLQNFRAGPEARGRKQMRHHLVQMRVHRLGRGRDIGVVRIKNPGIHRVAQLNERAIRAEHHAQRKRDLVVRHVFGLEKVVHQRRLAEVEDEPEVFRAAGAAGGAFLNHDCGGR